MTKVDIYTAEGNTKGSVDLPAEIFDVALNIPLIHQVVVGQLAAARQGTHSVKTRAEVRGGGRKPHKQKGTGRARQGSIRAPQFVGGGIVHGPTPRNYEQRTPKKMKAAALRGALSDRARNNRVYVIDCVIDGEIPSTKAALVALAALGERAQREQAQRENAKLLIVAELTDVLTWLSLRNASHVHLLAPDQLNTYDVLCNDDVVFTTGALNAFLTRTVVGWANDPVATEVDPVATETDPASTELNEEDAK